MALGVPILKHFRVVLTKCLLVFVHKINIFADEEKLAASMFLK